MRYEFFIYIRGLGWTYEGDYIFTVSKFVLFKSFSEIPLNSYGMKSTKVSRVSVRTEQFITTKSINLVTQSFVSLQSNLRCFRFHVLVFLTSKMYEPVLYTNI